MLRRHLVGPLTSSAVGLSSSWSRGRLRWSRRHFSNVAEVIADTKPFAARKIDGKELRSMLKEGPFPQARIRNFSIIAHVDHGKTTLSDALLKRCNVVADSDMAGVGNAAVYMDKLEVERERGITVKAQTASMFVTHPDTGVEYLLNLIDTPGHIDFAYEVQRSLTASEGAVLLVDASQGVQAQTVANFHHALNGDVNVIPALTKCDAVIDEARLAKVIAATEDATGFLDREIVRTSARQAKGLEAILRRVLDEVPAPAGNAAADAPPRAYLFDAWFGPHTRRVPTPGSGIIKLQSLDTVICAVRVGDGAIRVGDIVTLRHAGAGITAATAGAAGANASKSRKEYKVQDCGLLHPNPVSTGVLYAGMVGYVDLGMQNRKEASVGDTIVDPKRIKESPPMAPFKAMRPVMFATFHPNDGESYEAMKEAIERLAINDPSVTIRIVNCAAFGPGLQLGFFGQLHQSVFEDRLNSEYDLDVLVTPAQVAYKFRDAAGLEHELTVSSWDEHVTAGRGSGGGRGDGGLELLEPIVTAMIVCREQEFDAINSEATANYRGALEEMQTLEGERVAVKYRMPLSELIRGLMSRVMQISHGYASLEYGEPTYEPADLVKIDVQVNKRDLPALSTIVPKMNLQVEARRLVVALRENIKSVNYTLPIQAMVGGKIVARETVSAKRKDVLAKIHAGDYSRKAKKLGDQKKGKARLAARSMGDFTLDSEVLRAAMGATSL